MLTISMCFSLSVGLFSTFLFMAFYSVYLYMHTMVYFIEMDLVSDLNTCSINFMILVDWVSSLFIAVVSLISSVVMLYSKSYMSADKNMNKFIMVVLMFVLSMFLMIMSPNMLSILLGWDGLGLVSYCLVIYYQNVKSYSAGMLTVLSNRLGDLAILVSICWILNFGSMNLILITKVYSNSECLTLLCLTTLAATTKSAQIPFSAWLPAAMAAPTPVSSLVHSSTLVTAGVYLMIRFNFFSSLNYYLFLLSCVTMMMSGLGAFFEMDLKKVIALSTLSQLGVMMMIVSLGMKDLAFFHLLAHALFKSLLFLCAGFYIHSCSDWQDLRSVAKLSFLYPVFSMYFCVSSLALSGFPFLAGFYSKDLIIETLIMGINNIYLFILIFFSTAMTLVYSIRLIYLTFFMKMEFNTSFSVEEDFIMFAPMVVLFIFSVVGGSTMSWLFFPVNVVFLSTLTKLMLLIMLFLSFIFMLSFNGLVLLTNKLISFVSFMWMMPLISTYYFINLMKSSYSFMKLMDQGWLELLSSQGLTKELAVKSMNLDVSHLLNIKQMMYCMFILLLIFMFML